jgi:hypothetical protein
MNVHYKKFKIINGDTLQTLSLKLGLRMDEMIGYHNIYANEKEYIYYDIPIGLEEIYVYPYIYKKIKDDRLKVKLESNYKLAHKPKKETLKYGVMYFINSGEDENTVKFEVSVSYLNQNERGLHFEIDKISPTFINDLEADIIANELAEKVSAIVYPLRVIVNHIGKWVSIANFTEIKSRWDIVKATIYKDYEGEWVDNYIEKSERNLINENTFTHSLTDNWFLNTYFGGIYTYYTDSFSFETNIDFPVIIGIKELNYSVNYNLQELLNNEDIVKIDVLGILDDTRSKADLENNLNFANQVIEEPNPKKATGNYQAKYFLNIETQSIESIILECSVNIDKPQKIKVVIALID